jgi:putative flippase GtrA
LEINNRSGSGRFDYPRLVKFLGAGVLNTAFGYAMYAALLFFNMPYLAALLLATVAGVVFNYFSFGRMVFNGYGGGLVFRKFVIAYLILYCVNAVLLGGLTRIFLLSPYLGQVICIPPSVILGWILMNYWVYKND